MKANCYYCNLEDEIGSVTELDKKLEIRQINTGSVIACKNTEKCDRRWWDQNPPKRQQIEDQESFSKP